MIAEKEKFLSISHKIFSEFYSHFLQDYHAAAFFNSPFTIEKLIKAQSELLYKVLKLIQEKDEVCQRPFSEQGSGNAWSSELKCDDTALKTAEIELETVAKRHYQLGISRDTMFDSIDYQIDLLKLYQEELGLESTTIVRLKEMLDKTTADAYIKGIIGYVINFIINGDNIHTYSKYDSFFKEGIKNKLEAIEKAFKEASEEHLKAEMQSHIDCKLGQILHGLGFDIMSFGAEAIRVKTIEVHKDVHNYMNQLIGYYLSKDYRKAASISNYLINAVYELIYNYEVISSRWNQDKEILIPQILNNKKYKGKLSLLVLNFFGSGTDRHFDKQCDTILKMLRNTVVKHMENFNQLFFNKVKNEVYVFVNTDLTYNFVNFYNSLIKDIELLAEDLKASNVVIGNHPVFYIYKFDINRFLEVSSEELNEMINIIKEESKTKFKELAPPLVVVDVSDRKLELWEKAKANLELKDIVLKKVKNKDVDIFIQWIYDKNLKNRFFEVLVRIKQGDTYIPAYKFIDILQRENAMTLLDIAVISKVLENVDKIKAITHEFYLNIYPPSLENGEVVGLLKELVKTLSQNEVILNLELTEYAITTNKELFENDMKDNSFYLALDDFGTGYTNYELIGELSESGLIKTIKIDGAIVKKILDSQVYMSMVETITMFCKRNKLRVIYEFVDSNQILEALTNIASSIHFPKEFMFFQGFYLHKPNALEEEYKKLTKPNPKDESLKV
jgi:EAL domain-containing protein (putative c-di-GMP-specific phosphodiesterase class I)